MPPHNTYRNLDATMLYTFSSTLTQGGFFRFNFLKHRDEVLQVFLNCYNLKWGVFNGLPKPVKLDASFSELESNRDNSES